MIEQKTSGLGFQVSGSHYTNMKMQPVELAYRLGATPCFCKLAKYLTRDKGDKSVNLQKARHCVTLEMDLEQLAVGYCAVLTNYNTVAQIQDFTEDKLIQRALISMWHMDYTETLKVVDQIISRYTGSLGC